MVYTEKLVIYDDYCCLSKMVVGVIWTLRWKMMLMLRRMVTSSPLACYYWMEMVCLWVTTTQLHEYLVAADYSV